MVRCGDRHAAEPLMADAPVGLDTAAAFAERSGELALTTATAQRMLLAARRGGVETREVLHELEPPSTRRSGSRCWFTPFRPRRAARS